MNYKHLTAAQRGAIEVLLQKNYSRKDIADAIGVDKSTVSREINKRSTPNGYKAKYAQIDYKTRRKKSKQKKKMDYSRRQKYVTQKLRDGWSPEQISGRLKLKGSVLYVCPESIYAWIYEDEWAKEEKLYEYLRLGRKKRKKKGGRKVHRHKIPNRVSIHERPAIVDQRIEFGHWEGDSVIYANKKAINTLNELVTGLVKFTKLDRKTAKLTKGAMVKHLKEYEAKTVTVDNGTEFTFHEKITQSSGTQVYFADPYSSWQRGANENANMLLRGYLPKKADINYLTQEELDSIAWELNNRPRKRLGYLTPIEVYYLMLNSKKGGQTKVALGPRM